MKGQSYSGAHLLEFVTSKMAMSAYYQPLIIRELILAEGHRMDAADLARELLLHDAFAVSKARKALMRWPKRTLGRHGIAHYDRGSREFILPVEFDDTEQCDEVLAACNKAIADWARKEAPKVASRDFKLIERAGGRCQACGVLGSVRPLDVDHVIPKERAQDGYVTPPGRQRIPVDDERNLQVLCSHCNRGKRDTSTYDFRPSPERMAETIRLTLQLASQYGYDTHGVLAAVLKRATDAGNPSGERLSCGSR